MKNGLAKLILALTVLFAPVLVAGCVSLGDAQVGDTEDVGATASHPETSFQHTILDLVDTEEPEVSEVMTIQIDSTVGLYYVPPNADVESELEFMGATVIDHGALYAACMGER